MNKALKTLTIVLVIVLISLISFFGIFRENLNEMKNVLPEYKLGMEYAGTRTFVFTVDTSTSEKTVYEDKDGNVYDTKPEEDNIENTENTDNEEETENTENSDTEESKYTEKKIEVPVNDEKNLTLENFEKSKKIMQKRLEKLGASEYNIRLNNENGKIMVEVPDDNLVQSVYTSLSTTGDVKVIDKETSEVLIGNEHIKKAETLYSSENGTSIYLQFEFDKEGKKLLSEISQKYVKTSDEEGNDTTKYVSVTVDDSAIITTYFGETIDTGILQIPLGQSLTDAEKILEYVQTAENLKNVIQSGKMPIVYKLENDNFIKSSITDTQKQIALIASIVVVAITIVYFIIKYKFNGVLAGVLNIGFIALLLIAIRYTNVIITTGGIVTFIAMYFVNLLMLNGLLRRIKDGARVDEAIKEVVQTVITRGIHVVILTVVFTFSSNAQINSIGMISLWSILVMICYSTIFTRTLYKINTK